MGRPALRADPREKGSRVSAELTAYELDLRSYCYDVLSASASLRAATFVFQNPHPWANVSGCDLDARETGSW